MKLLDDAPQFAEKERRLIERVDSRSMQIFNDLLLEAGKNFGETNTLVEIQSKPIRVVNVRRKYSLEASERTDVDHVNGSPLRVVSDPHDEHETIG